MLHTKRKHVKTALYALAYGASHKRVKRNLAKSRRLTARQVAATIKWAEFTLYSLSYT